VSLSQTIRDVTRRVGRKAILVTHSLGMPQALHIAEENKSRISDVIVLDAPHGPDGNGVRTHFISSGWSPMHGVMALPQLLRKIAIELIEEPVP
jgi:pimeloyl-ACP methyl ester carboxylesterase